MPSQVFFRRIRDRVLCRECGFCEEVVVCPSPGDCIGCGACCRGCPHEAVRMVEDKSPRGSVSIRVDGVKVEVPERTTVKRALETLGISFGKYPGDCQIFAPCETGGCYSCSVLIDGELTRSCVTRVEDGMDVWTEVPEKATPLRIIHGPEPHPVGGKATPWWLKSRGRYIEVAIWAAGCNLSCPQCQNYSVTYDGRSTPMTPREAAELVSAARRFYGVDRMAISGGEPTLNRRWLIEYFRELRRLNPESHARLHLDSNGTILTPEYIDSLVLEAGVTDIGIEPKGVCLETFMKITAVGNRDLAERYLETSWNAVKYVVDNHGESVFLGVGLPYNRMFMTLEEVARFGERLASIDPEVQLCVLDYFPAFRRREMERPSPREMLEVKEILEGRGLRTVVVQTSVGHLGP